MDELSWDYRSSLQLIRNFIDARTLAGCAAWQDGEPAGYGFYVLEEHKGLIGGLYVAERFPRASVARRLLDDMLQTLRNIPRLERVEVQLMPCGEELDEVLEARRFRLYHRQFMMLDLDQARAGRELPQAGLRLEPWTDRWLHPASRLIRLAYENHIDGEINDQYCSEAGANRFLRNIVYLRGCGEFIPQASFLLCGPQSDIPLGMVLSSAVAPGVGHTTQLCVLPGYQGRGLGRRLLETAVASLRHRAFRALSLTVTSSNEPAIALYESMGFGTRHTFSAGVWRP
ncbi:MAG TPA: GNAT family N-acetyltransferase [Candidatus Acidoferrales bacterium]|nr:GNAT family N-acetyltransferase [Candidatus Acidoferrales bacterium]